MASRSGPAVDRVMFGAGHRQHVVGIVALDALDKLDANLAREIRDLLRKFPGRGPSADRGKC